MNDSATSDGSIAVPAAAPQATNSIDALRAVAPATSRISGVKPRFLHAVPAHAIVVLTLEAR